MFPQCMILAVMLTSRLAEADVKNTDSPLTYPRYSFNNALQHLLWLSNCSNKLGRFNASFLSQFAPETRKKFSELREILSGGDYTDRSKCIEDIVSIISGFFDPSITAKYKWIDASGRPLPGISGGSIHWPGSFDLCLNTYGDFNISRPLVPDDQKENITDAHYCDFVIDLPVPMELSVPASLGVSIGLCIPSTCDISDAVGMIDPVLSTMSLKVDQVATYCHSSPDVLPKDRWFWIGTALTSFYLTLMAFGTALEVAIWMQWKMGRLNETKIEYSSAPDGQRLLEEDLEEDHRDSDMNTVGQSQDATHANYTAIRRKYLNSQPLIIQWFSVYSVPINAAQLWNAPRTTLIDSAGNVIDHPLSVLDGIRFFTMTWIIYGHCIVFSMLQSNNVLLFAQSHLKRWTFQAIVSGTFSVDTFFLMSGLLTSYITIPRLNQVNSVANSARFWSIFVLHRIIRLTPAYLTVIILYTGFFHHAWDGPLFPQRAELTDVQFCHSYWWVTYLNNLIHSDKMCLPWSWYLANELQFSIVLAPIFLSLLRFHASAGLTFALALILSSIGSAYGLSYANNYLPGMLSFQSFTVMYMKPYTRWGTYAMGLILGWILHSDRFKLPLKTSPQRAMLFTLGGMSLATVCCVTTVYGLYGVVSGQTPEITNGVSAFYNAVSRPVFILGIACIIFLCANQYATPIRAFLSWSGFSPLSRLTYGAYLIHPIVIMFIRFGAQSPALLDDLLLMTMFVATVCFSYMASFILAMATESPILMMEKRLIHY